MSGRVCLVGSGSVFGEIFTVNKKTSVNENCCPEKLKSITRSEFATNNSAQSVLPGFLILVLVHTRHPRSALL